jgi:hypothetical protein
MGRVKAFLRDITDTPDPTVDRAQDYLVHNFKEYERKPKVIYIVANPQPG